MSQTNLVTELDTGSAALPALMDALTRRMKALEDEDLSDLDRRLAGVLNQVDALRKKTKEPTAELSAHATKVCMKTGWRSLAVAASTTIARSPLWNRRGVARTTGPCSYSGAFLFVKQVAELHETVAKWDAVASAIPSLVDRLEALKTLHSQCADFGLTVSHLETLQSQLRDSLSGQKGTLETVGPC